MKTLLLAALVAALSGLPPALLLVMRPPLIRTIVFRPGMNESV